MLCVVLYVSIYDKGHLGNRVTRNCRIAVSNRFFDRLEMVNAACPEYDRISDLPVKAVQLCSKVPNLAEKNIGKSSHYTAVYNGAVFDGQYTLEC